MKNEGKGRLEKRGGGFRMEREEGEGGRKKKEKRRRMQTGKSGRRENIDREGG